jgi:AraC family transcriptional regulator, regulatory protein of adaptative response / methylated-DNA-[protein]-cysteine methyltransferase
MLNEELLWTAVRARDAHWDGAFVYAVPSTKIYCRPTCPSRRPRRDGVRFFVAPAAAEAAGFRPCKRCRPGAAAADPAIERVQRVCATIAARADEPLTLATLARDVGSSPHHLLRTFKQTLGISPREYIDACRIGCFKAELQSGHGVAAATYAAGYGSGSRVYENAQGRMGMTPAVYASGGAGVAVHYVTTESPLGTLLVAATEHGVCAVKLGSNAESLERELRREYPAAVVTSGDPRLSGWVSRILDSLEPGAPDPRLPIDVRATAFQRLVWRELQRIPRGQTQSYSDIAKRIGRPTAVRAVARACATNPVALVVPCHRVVQSNKGLGGYRWGKERKRALLEGERG